MPTPTIDGSQSAGDDAHVAEERRLAALPFHAHSSAHAPSKTARRPPRRSARQRAARRQPRPSSLKSVVALVREEVRVLGERRRAAPARPRDELRVRCTARRRRRRRARAARRSSLHHPRRHRDRRLRLRAPPPRAALRQQAQPLAVGVARPPPLRVAHLLGSGAPSKTTSGATPCAAARAAVPSDRVAARSPAAHAHAPRCSQIDASTATGGRGTANGTSASRRRRRVEARCPWSRVCQAEMQRKTLCAP